MSPKLWNLLKSADAYAVWNRFEVVWGQLVIQCETNDAIPVKILPIYQLKIAEWAKLNKTNPFDMGPKNYQRCLYDLKLGGKYHQLEYNEDGSLKYQ